jgi:hypothetical protein
LVGFAVFDQNLSCAVVKKVVISIKFREFDVRNLKKVVKWKKKELLGESLLPRTKNMSLE